MKKNKTFKMSELCMERIKELTLLSGNSQSNIIEDSVNVLWYLINIDWSNTDDKFFKDYFLKSIISYKKSC